jgi:hypothetical protein
VVICQHRSSFYRISGETDHSGRYIAALGAVVGYIGAEAANGNIFERLAWPQRAYSNLNIRNALKIAFLMPYGGLLFKPVMAIMDTASRNGTLSGRGQGHMLGTIFYPDSSTVYDVYDRGSDAPSEIKKEARNNTWLRIARIISMRATPPKKADVERGKSVPEETRSRLATCHLTFTTEKLPKTSKWSNDFSIDVETTSPGPRAVLGTLVSELTGIGMMALVSI